MTEYPSVTIRKRVGCGSVYCVFSEKDGKFHRLFLYGNNSKEAQCGEVWLDTMSRLLTYLLRRKGDDFDEGILKQLIGGHCHTFTANKERITSCPDAIGKAVRQYIKEKNL